MNAAANRRITTLAADRALHRAFAWLHLHEPQLRRWQLELLAIPAPPFHESARAAWFLDRFRDLNLHNPHLDALGNALAEIPSALQPSSHPEASKHPEAGNLRLQPEVSSGLIAPEKKDGGFSPQQPPCILLSAHLDTVFPPATNCTPREDGPSILCPGACDNAAGLTALLALAAAIQHADIHPQTTILLCANVGEEGPGNLRGMRHLFSPDSPYFGRITTAIALEGSGTTTVIDRALGSSRLRVTVTGPGGHSWADAGRPNPVLTLSSALLAVSRIPLPTTPRTTLNVASLHGGTTVNSIPATATAELDLRSASAELLTQLEATVRHTLATELDPATLTIAPIGHRPSGTLDPHSTLANSLRAVDRHLRIATDSRLGSTDANIPLALNIPALAIGCGGTGWGIHTLLEGYDPTGRDLALRRILLLLLDATTQPV